MITILTIQLTRSGVVGAADVVELVSQFETRHVFRLPQLLHPELLEMVCRRLDASPWTTRDDGHIAREAIPDDIGPVTALNFALNTAGFLELVRSITRCKDITWFVGRVYRMSPDTDHFDSWHSDLGSSKERLVGLSINLGRNPYQGGVFRLRDERNGQVLCELPNTGFGDAIFFRISAYLKHMVTPVKAAVPKTAFAGWFRSGQRNYYADLQQSARQDESTSPEPQPAP
jgi:hypothetical protein